MINAPNSRLWEAKQSAGLTYADLAQAARVNPKTVQRWCYEGRTPRRATAHRVARCLSVEVAWLWPHLASSWLGDQARPRDLVEFFAQAGSISDGLLRDLVDLAKTEISVVTDSAWLMAEIGAGHGGYLQARAREGAEVRLLCAAACRADVAPGLRCRVLSRPVGVSIVRADLTMLVICGGLGIEAAAMPLFMFRSTESGDVFDVYAQGFERLWQEAAL